MAIAENIKFTIVKESMLLYNEVQIHQMADKRWKTITQEELL